MVFHEAKEAAERFAHYVGELVGVIGHADRAGPLRGYCTGLLLPGERKSVEPMAALTAPARTAAQHQSLLHFVGQAPWSDAAVLTKVRELVLPHLERHGPIAAWIIDDRLLAAGRADGLFFALPTMAWACRPNTGTGSPNPMSPPAPKAPGWDWRLCARSSKTMAAR